MRRSECLISGYRGILHQFEHIRTFSITKNATHDANAAPLIWAKQILKNVLSIVVMNLLRECFETIRNMKHELCDYKLNSLSHLTMHEQEVPKRGFHQQRVRFGTGQNVIQLLNFQFNHIRHYRRVRNEHRKQ